MIFDTTKLVQQVNALNKLPLAGVDQKIFEAIHEIATVLQEANKRPVVDQELRNCLQETMAGMQSSASEAMDGVAGLAVLMTAIMGVMIKKGICTEDDFITVGSASTSAFMASIEAMKKEVEGST